MLSLTRTQLASRMDIIPITCTVIKTRWSSSPSNNFNASAKKWSLVALLSFGSALALGRSENLQPSAKRVLRSNDEQCLGMPYLKSSMKWSLLKGAKIGYPQQKYKASKCPTSSLSEVTVVPDLFLWFGLKIIGESSDSLLSPRMTSWPRDLADWMTLLNSGFVGCSCHIPTIGWPDGGSNVQFISLSWILSFSNSFDKMLPCKAWFQGSVWSFWWLWEEIWKFPTKGCIVGGKLPAVWADSKAWSIAWRLPSCG